MVLYSMVYQVLVFFGQPCFNKLLQTKSSLHFERTSYDLALFNSIESEIDIRKLLFIGRLLTEPKMTFVVKSLFQSRAASYFDPNIKSVGVLPSICDTLCKYNLFTYFETWFHNSIFPCYEEWKSIVYHEVRNSEMNKWTEYCVSHPNLHVAKACIDNIPPQ